MRMLKYTNNQKGLTLIELLAAMALTGVVLTTAIFFFTELTGFTKTQSEDIRSQKDARNTLAQISSILQDSVGIYKPVDPNEVRYSVFVNDTTLAYKAIYYNNGSLTIYNFTGSAADWSTESISYANSPAKYAQGFAIARQLASAPVYSIKSIAAGNTTTTAPLARSAAKDSLIEISIEYADKRKTADGGLHSELVTDGGPDSGSVKKIKLQTTFKRYNDGL